MTDLVREIFETTTAELLGIPNYSKECIYDFKAKKKVWVRKPNGEYLSTVLEDHWQTFQEGWDAALEYLTRADISAQRSCAINAIMNGEKDQR
jgi:hypothetical protein